jgi:PAS domain S-box-containing protein
MIRNKRIIKFLVVEDNPGDFALVEEFLSEQFPSSTITHAENFKQASGILQSTNDSFDIILLDLTLPDSSGQHLITEMLLIASECPIIILTGYADVDFSINSISLGILDYLLKDELNAGMLYKSINYAIERKKTIADLKESEKRYSDLFHASPQPMWVYDLDTRRFLQVNKAALLQYGYSLEEFLNMTIFDIRPAEENTKLIEILARRRDEKEETYKGNFKHQKKSGEIIEVEIYSTPILINNKKAYSVIANDVTEKKLFEHKITKAIIKTQEDERYEIGGELHDNVCQILASSRMTLEMLKGSLGPSSIHWFDQSEKNIVLALEEIRNLSHRLAPAFFDETTLEEAFSKLFSSFNLTSNYKIILLFDDTVKKIPIDIEIELNLYRILQEQLRNILKHAHATLIEVEVIIKNNVLNMIVSDNGIGFNVESIKKGIGLANMKRRAELFSGNFHIESSPGHGCKLAVDIPLQHEHLRKTEKNRSNTWI